jgi:aspartyl-tRNA(Asn)/glutamyl-tRNA(Gln) amidotransferase subunit A
MRERDALLTPTLPITATALADVDEASTPLATWTRTANYLGACALSLPAGFSADGLPIGVQVIGTAFADATLVRIGRAFQQATDGTCGSPTSRRRARAPATTFSSIRRASPRRNLKRRAGSGVSEPSPRM